MLNRRGGNTLGTNQRPTPVKSPKQLAIEASRPMPKPGLSSIASYRGTDAKGRAISVSAGYVNEAKRRAIEQAGSRASREATNPGYPDWLADDMPAEASFAPPSPMYRARPRTGRDFDDVEPGGIRPNEITDEPHTTPFVPPLRPDPKQYLLQSLTDADLPKQSPLPTFTPESEDSRKAAAINASRGAQTIPAVAAIVNLLGLGGNTATNLAAGPPLTAAALEGSGQGADERYLRDLKRHATDYQRVEDTNNLAQQGFMNKGRVIASLNDATKDRFDAQREVFNDYQNQEIKRDDLMRKGRDAYIKYVFSMGANPRQQEQVLKNDPQAQEYGIGPQYDAQGNYVPYLSAVDAARGQNAQTNAQNAATNAQRAKDIVSLAIKGFQNKKDVAGIQGRNALAVANASGSWRVKVADILAGSRKEIAEAAQSGAMLRSIFVQGAIGDRQNLSLQQQERLFQQRYGVNSASAMGQEITSGFARLNRVEIDRGVALSKLQNIRYERVNLDPKYVPATEPQRSQYLQERDATLNEMQADAEDAVRRLDEEHGRVQQRLDELVNRRDGLTPLNPKGAGVDMSRRPGESAGAYVQRLR